MKRFYRRDAKCAEKRGEKQKLAILCARSAVKNYTYADLGIIT